MALALTAICSFIIGGFLGAILGRKFWIRSGGRPQFTMGPECDPETGEIVFDIDPRTDTGFTLVQVESTLGGDHKVHSSITGPFRHFSGSSTGMQLVVLCRFSVDDPTNSVEDEAPACEISPP